MTSASQSDAAQSMGCPVTSLMIISRASSCLGKSLRTEIETSGRIATSFVGTLLWATRKDGSKLTTRMPRAFSKRRDHWLGSDSFVGHSARSRNVQKAVAGGESPRHGSYREGLAARDVSNPRDRGKTAGASGVRDGPGAPTSSVVVGPPAEARSSARARCARRDKTEGLPRGAGTMTASQAKARRV